MNADGTHQINITNNPAEDRDPAWSSQSITEQVISTPSKVLCETPHPSKEPSLTPPHPEEASPGMFLVVLVITLVAILNNLYKRIGKRR